MSDEIKVWAVVKPDGNIAEGSVCSSAALSKLMAKDATRSGWGKLTAEGFSVQPYTLTKGHKP